MRTVAIAILTAAVELGALFLIWQLRTFVSWFVAALFLAAVLNPLVNWSQRRHRMIKRPLAIGLTYLGLLVALLLIVGIFLPVIVDQINSLIKFIGGVQNAPGGAAGVHQGSLPAKRVGFFVPEGQRPAR